MIMNAFLPAVQMSGDSLEWLITGQSIPVSYRNSEITTLRKYAFCNVGASGVAQFDNVTYASCYCFSGASFAEISMPKLQPSYLVSSIFAYTSAKVIRVPLMRLFPPYTFYSCMQLKDIFWNMDDDTTQSFDFRASCLQGCDKLTHISLPVAKYYALWSAAFRGCSSVQSIIFKGYVSTWQASVFMGCRSLNTVVFKSGASQVGTTAFSSCYNLLSIYLLGSTITKLQNVNAFTSTPISTYTTSTGGVYGSIYVPSSLYATYSTSTNWATYAARFVSLTDAQIAALPF